MRHDRLIRQIAADIVGHRCRGGVAPGLIFFQRLGDDGLNITAVDTVNRAERRRVFFANRSYDFMERLPGGVIRQLPRQQFIGDDTERVDVAAHIEFQRVGKHLLRTHVIERADQLSDVGLPCRFHVGVGDACNSEIENLGLACLVDEDVTGFQVPVNDAALMRVVHRIADLRNQFQTRTQIEMLLPRELNQRLAAR